MESWKDVLTFLTGLTGSSFMVLAGIASFMGKWMWTHQHLQIVAMKDQQIAEHRERADFWQQFAMKDRGLTEVAVKTTQVAVEKMDGASI